MQGLAIVSAPSTVGNFLGVESLRNILRQDPSSIAFENEPQKHIEFSLLSETSFE